MTRRKQRRFVGRLPVKTVFKPIGTPASELEQVVLELDEFEALRLVDLEGLYQDAAAERMGVSRPTLGRILQAAHHKVADAIIHGKAIIIREQSPFARSGDRCGSRCCASRKRRFAKCAGQRSSREQRQIHEPGNSKEHPMIIVSAQGKEWNSPLDQRFGRTPFLLLIDPETNQIEVIDNREQAEAPSGAGVQTAQVVLNSRADVLITGRLGPKADDIIRASDIEVVLSGPCSVREAVDQYLQNR